MVLLPKYILNVSTSLHLHSPTLIQATVLSHMTIWSPRSPCGLLCLSVLHTTARGIFLKYKSGHTIPLWKNLLFTCFLLPLKSLLWPGRSHLPAYDSRPYSHRSHLPPDTPATAQCLFPIQVIKPLEKSQKFCKVHYVSIWGNVTTPLPEASTSPKVITRNYFSWFFGTFAPTSLNTMLLRLLLFLSLACSIECLRGKMRIPSFTLLSSPSPKSTLPIPLSSQHSYLIIAVRWIHYVYIILAI